MRVRSLIPASTCIQELLDFLRGRDEENDSDNEEEACRRVMGPLLWSVGVEPHRRRLLRALKVGVLHVSPSQYHNMCRPAVVVLVRPAMWSLMVPTHSLSSAQTRILARAWPIWRPISRT